VFFADGGLACRRPFRHTGTAFRVRSVQGIGDFNREAQQYIGFDGPRPNAMLQCHAIQKLHDDE
jgi:hypothetical protein